MELGDVTWGDVVSDDDGVLVVRGTVGGDPVVVKRYAEPAMAREIAHHQLLELLGVPTLPLLGAGEDWLVRADLADAGYRPGTPDDLYDPHVARLVAGWYDQLHAAGESVPLAGLAGLSSEYDLVDAAGLGRVAARWPDLALQVAWAQDQLPEWRRVLADLPRTLTHNDFWYTNLAVAWDDSAALMVDHHLVGAGLRAGDVRNVRLSLSAEAGAAFREEYLRLAAARGVEWDERAAAVDEPLGHLAALVLASEADEAPAWAGESLAWLAAQGPGG